MPFKSQDQATWAYATKQPFAKEWSSKTDYQKLPKKVPEKNNPMRNALKKKLGGENA